MSKQEGVKPKKHSSSFLKELFKTKPLAGLGLIVLILLVLVAIFADVLAPYPMVDGQMTTSVIDKLEDPFFLLDAEEKATAQVRALIVGFVSTMHTLMTEQYFADKYHGERNDRRK